MITIVLPISRKDYLKPVFDCLNALICPKDTELLIITDGDNGLEKAVNRRLDSINFRHIQVISYGDGPAKSIDNRRYRIADIHNLAKTHVGDAEYVFLIEDDTTYPPYALAKMLDTFNYYENCAYVEGVELGRHKTKYVGAWQVIELSENIDPFHILSAMPSKGIESIDAGGLYCALVKANLYKEHTFEPYDKVGTNGLGCDVNFGISLRRLGYDCYIDWDIQCDHIGDKGSVNLGNTKPVQVEFVKDYKGKWNGRTIV